MFQISPMFSKNCKILLEISKILPFPENISDFHPPKFLMTFFQSHRPQMLNFPLFCLFWYISPLGENYYFPLLSQIFLCFPKIHQLFTYMDFPRIFPPTLTMMHLCITQCT